MAHLLTALCALLLAAQLPAAGLFDYVLPWDDASASPTNLSAMNAASAGSQGWVTVNGEGHLATQAGRIRFWGVNNCFTNNFPSHTEADAIAARMAKFGVNIVRFHHMDLNAYPDGIWSSMSPDRTLSASALDRLDYFVYALKRAGIYSDLNLVVARPFNYSAALADLNPAISSIGDGKVRAAVGFFDPQIQALQRQYAADLLTHVNPYTGSAYVDEPAVAFVEINNENGLAQAYLLGSLDTLPDYYKNELNTLWNQWLGAKYADDAALQAAWGVQNQALGAEMLANGDFASAPSSGWWLNVVSPAVATVTREAGAGPTGAEAACRVDITTADAANTWHVQLTQSGLSVADSQPYTLTFWARASSSRSINVNIGMNHTPWSTLGFSNAVALTTAWQKFSYTFTVTADANARLGFDGLAAAAGSVWLSGVTLKPGGLVGLYQGEVLGSMRNFLNSGEVVGRTAGGKRDWMQFLLATEEAYWRAMRSHVKTTLGSRSLIFGTVMGCTTPNLAALFDVVDTHKYWQHPAFPGASWSTTDWYVNNLAMVDSPSTSTFADVAMKNIAGKPHAVTEYNHPAPNRFQAEDMPFLAAYASLQDYDAVFAFDYASWRAVWNTRYSNSYFDVDQNPAKMSLFTACAQAFRRFDIAPAAKQVVVSMDRSLELDKMLSASSWTLVDASSAGANPLEGFVHRVALAVEGQAIPAGSLSPNSALTGPVLTSDTGELVWNATGGTGVVSVDTARTKMVFGWGGGKTFALSGVTITPSSASLNAGWGVWALSAMDGAGVADASTLLLTAVGGTLNTGQSLYNYSTGAALTYPPAKGVQLTSKAAWGSAPSRVDAPAVTLDLPFAPARVRFFACDATGNTKTELAVADNNGLARVAVDGGEQAVWFVVRVDQGMYSPTATPSVTPTFSASPTPSESPTASLSPTVSVTPSPFPTRTFTPTRTVTPTRTATGTPTSSATPSATASPSPTASATASATGTPSATATATPTATEGPADSPTATATASATPAATQAATPGPAGPPTIVRALAWPNPGARGLMVRLAAPADGLSVRLWTPGYTLACAFEAGPLPAGWNLVPLPRGCAGALPRGLFYATLESRGQGVLCSGPGTVKLYR